MQQVIPLKIRKATLQDAKGIALVHVTAWQESYKGIIAQNVLDDLSGEQHLLSWIKSLQDSPEEHFVACVNENIIGFCRAGPARSDLGKGEIYALYILNAYKGRGVGYQLFSAAASFLTAKGLSPYITKTLEANKPARAFYERQGGVVCGTSTYITDGKTYPEVCYRF
jgi:ribosomal protein S18 acetylase RimI-like enzyme